METTWCATGENFISVVNACSDVMVVCRLDDGGCLAVNESFTALTGYAAAEIAAEGGESWISAENWQGLCAEIQQAGQANGLTIALRTKAGAARMVQASARRIEFDGAPSLLVIAHELTPSQKAEAALRASEERYRDIFENAVEGIFQSTPGGRYLSVNNAMARIFGYASPEEMIATVGDDMEHRVYMNPEDRAAFRRSLEENGTVKEFEGLNRRKDGSSIWTRTNGRAVRDASGTLLYYEGFVEDITERVRSEQERQRLAEALTKEQYLFSALMDNAPAKIYFKDMASRFSRVNRAMVGMFGASDPAQLLGKTDFDFFTGDHAQQAFKDEQAMLRTGQPLVGKKERETRLDGRETWALTTKMPLYDEVGKITGTFGISTDITERKQMDVALRESEARFRGLFEYAPISLWEEDLSAVKAWLEDLRQQGVTDVEKYFASHPEAVEECIRRIKVLDVNQATVKLYGAQSKSELLNSLVQVFGPEPGRVVAEELVAPLARGEREFESAGVNHKLTGERMDVILHWFIPSTHEQTLSRVVVSLEDITARKAAEAALKRSEEKFATAFRNSPDAYVITSMPDGKIIQVNESFFRLAGLTPEEIAGKTTLELNLWESLEDRDQFLAALQKAGRVLNFETTFRKKTGELRIGWISGEFLQLQEGQCVLTVIHDITARKLAEERLTQTLERLELATRAGGLGIWDWDIRRNEHVWNDRMYELFGIKPGDFDGTNEAWLARVHPDDRAAINEISRQAQRGEQEYDTEYRVLWPDGTARVLRAVGQFVRDAAGQPLRMTGVIYDLTERKQAEKVLAQEQSLMQALMDNMPNRIYFKDRASRFIRISRSQARHLGLSDPAQAVGKTDFDFFTEEHAGPAYQDEQEIIRTGQPVIREEKETWADRPDTWVSTIKLPLHDKDGNTLGTFGISMDITERKRAEEALQAYSEKLEEKVEARTRELRDAQAQLVRREKLAVLGQMSGGIAHELRQPLAVISNAVYFLKAVQPDAAPTIREYLGLITAELYTADRIIADLLSFARAGSAKKEPVVVATLVEQALARNPAPPGIAVQVALPHGLPPVYVDSQQMGQVLNNLITNAYQAMPRGGQLTLAAAPSAAGFISLGVADTGEGIAPENMPKLFEPLFTTKTKGIGLGLIVTKMLVEANGGTIKVTSEAGRGATFQLTLPTKEEPV